MAVGDSPAKIPLQPPPDPDQLIQGWAWMADPAPWPMHASPASMKQRALCPRSPPHVEMMLVFGFIIVTPANPSLCVLVGLARFQLPQDGSKQTRAKAAAGIKERPKSEDVLIFPLIRKTVYSAMQKKPSNNGQGQARGRWGGVRVRLGEEKGTFGCRSPGEKSRILRVQGAEGASAMSGAEGATSHASGGGDGEEGGRHSGVHFVEGTAEEGSNSRPLSPMVKGDSLR